MPRLWIVGWTCERLFGVDGRNHRCPLRLPLSYAKIVVVVVVCKKLVFGGRAECVGTRPNRRIHRKTTRTRNCLCYRLRQSRQILVLNTTRNPKLWFVRVFGIHGHLLVHRRRPDDEAKRQFVAVSRHQIVSKSGRRVECHQTTGKVWDYRNRLQIASCWNKPKIKSKRAVGLWHFCR